ncbi:hypothetical protein BrevBR_15410 [Brevundimonas sp. BR2-1]|uniref:hypothetical protein n=1 Tax=Brevundimonas sp. BR2-1 TaxID=3031123 RepID=UPI0030B6346F
MTSVVAYLFFVLAGLNGDAWWHANKLWATVVLARAHVLAAWAVFVVFGAAAFVFRRRLGNRLFVVGAGLLGLPVCWALSLRFFYYSQPGGWWPGFGDDVWRWVVNHVYAEFAVGLMIGFLGLAAVTLDGRAVTDRE